MRINLNLNVGLLVELQPQTEEVLASYGVEFVDDDLELNIRDLCNEYELDPVEIMAELMGSVGE